MLSLGMKVLNLGGSEKKTELNFGKGTDLFDVPLLH